jgi:hypothetical protein
MCKLKEEAQALGKSSFAFAFYMDRCKEERERGVTIQCTTKEFYTNNWYLRIQYVFFRFQNKQFLDSNQIYKLFLQALYNHRRTWSS